MNLAKITIYSPNYSDMLFRCFLTKMFWILCRFKNWGLPWPLGVLLTLLLVAVLVFLYCKNCASRLKKRLLKARWGLNSLICIKFIIFLLKKTLKTCLNNEVKKCEVNLSPFRDYNVEMGDFIKILLPS